MGCHFHSFACLHSQDFCSDSNDRDSIFVRPPKIFFHEKTFEAGGVQFPLPPPGSSSSFWADHYIVGFIGFPEWKTQFNFLRKGIYYTVEGIQS